MEYRPAERPRPGDAFPNVGYVRQMTGRDSVGPAPDPALPPLIGLIGKKRAGKDTFARGLLRRGAVRYAFADPLKEAVLATDPIIEPYVRYEREGDFVNHFAAGVRLKWFVERAGWERAKELPEVRRLLQEFGVAIRAIDEDFWLRTTIDKAVADPRPAVITDVRFPNEAKAIADRGGALIRVVRPGLDSDDQHVSETALDDYPVDVVVDNVTTADDLVDVALHLAF